MRFTQEVITPDMAAQMLQNNYVNPRSIRAARVNEHARAMAAGEWDWQSPEPIILAEDGTLLDGQHRLSAVVRYGAPVQFTVCRGASKSSYQNLDSGITRALADRVHLCDNLTPAKHKVCVGIIKQWIKFRENKRSVVSPKQAIDFYERHHESLLWILPYFRVEKGIGRLQAAVALCMMFEVDPVKATAMAKGYYLNTMEVPNAIKMREMMISAIDVGSTTQTDLIGRCIALCKAELAGKVLKARIDRIPAARWIVDE